MPGERDHPSGGWGFSLPCRALGRGRVGGDGRGRLSLAHSLYPLALNGASHQWALLSRSLTQQASIECLLCAGPWGSRAHSLHLREGGLSPPQPQGPYAQEAQPGWIVESGGEKRKESISFIHPRIGQRLAEHLLCAAHHAKSLTVVIPFI